MRTTSRRVCKQDTMDVEVALGILAEIVVEMDGALVFLDCLTEKHGDNAILVDSQYAVMRLLKSFVERIASVIGALQTTRDSGKLHESTRS